MNSDHDELEVDELEDVEDDDLEDEEEKLDDEDDDEVEASDDPDEIADATNAADHAAASADVLCPECDAEIEQEIKRGVSLTCPGCSCKLEVLEVDPVRLMVAEELEGDEEGHSRRAPNANSKEDPSANGPKRIPGTRSVALGVVPSADPEAPYGRDENDKPLVPMRLDQDIAVDLRERRPDLAPGACPHKNDPNNCILCGTKKIRPRQEPTNQSLSSQRDLRHPATPEQLKSEHLDQMEENARRIFKTPKPFVRNSRASAAFSSLFDGNKSVVPPPQKLSLKFDCYRDLLKIERDTIAVLFDYIVDYIRPEKPAEGAVEQLQAEIAKLDALILTRSAAWQKRRRPADRLEKNDRVRLKRQETGLRNKKKAELSKARARLRHWQDTPPIPVTFGERYDITHRSVSTETKFIPDILRTPAGQEPYYTEPLVFVDTYHGGEYSIEGYRKLLKLGPDAIAQTSDGMTFPGWVEWENKVILQAIKIGLLTPNVDMLKKHPGLGVYRPVDRIEIDGTAENSLIIKTGGAEISGNIRGAGYRGKGNNTRRTLRDFNTPLRAGRGADGPESHPNDASEEDESYTPD
jgi:hypothetical protein